jgi:sugar phosphate isomerase/epimerase
MTKPVSIQLYTLREEAERNMGGVIERLGRIGYAGVEPSGASYIEPRQFRRWVEDAGMRVSSAHTPLPLGDEANRILDAQEELGNDTLIVPYLPYERFGSVDALRSTVDDLNRAAENVRARSMAYGYHNHWWEFSTRIDGRMAYDILLELLAPDIFVELDTYWAQAGGVDPLELLSRLGPRARYLHLKDGPATDPSQAVVALGEGSTDIAAVLAAGADAAWHVVELDRCDSDPFEAVERSFRYLVDRGFSHGKP